MLAIGQPAHAWLCGQFARAWGNERFGDVVPLAEVALAAEQHDVGMGPSDLAPARNPQTGLPRSFIEMGAAVNAELWRRGPIRLLPQSRYAALLAVMHGRRLYERRDLSTMAPDAVAAVARLLAESDELESKLTAALRDDPVAAPDATAELIARNSDLVWTWDTLSLVLLLDGAPHTLRGVPAAGGGIVDVEVLTVGQQDGLPTLSLSPWPFRDHLCGSGGRDRVLVRTEGRRLEGTYDSDAALAEGLATAPWETIRFALVPPDRC